MKEMRTWLETYQSRGIDLLAIDERGLGEITGEVAPGISVEQIDGGNHTWIRIQGRLDFAPLWGMATTYKNVVETFGSVLSEQPEQVTVEIESWGGTLKGLWSAATRIQELLESDDRTQVKVWIPSHATSAAWALAAAFAGSPKNIIASRYADIGSVGVIMTRADWSKLFEKEGIKIHVFRYPAKKALGALYEKASESELVGHLKRVQQAYSEFSAFFQERGFEDTKFWNAREGLSFPANKHPSLIGKYTEDYRMDGKEKKKQEKAETEALMSEMAQLQKKFALLEEQLRAEKERAEQAKAELEQEKARRQVSIAQAEGQIVPGQEALEAMTAVVLRAGGLEWLQFIPVAAKKAHESDDRTQVQAPPPEGAAPNDDALLDKWDWSQVQ